MLDQILSILSPLLYPVLAITVIDDWFIRPKRRIAALPAVAPDPVWLRWLYTALPLLILAAAIKLFRSERLDFSLVLLLVSVIGGLIWALDHWVLRRWRNQLAVAAGKNPASVPEPGIVDYARSMVPVVLFVLVLRSFLFEPFRIPSDSMMPTLQDGDFILVNKFAYGVRLPVINKKIISVNDPQRGDVVVFRYPPDPAINYIKRVVGLPGDRVKVIADRVYVNDQPLPESDLGRYSDGCYENMRLAQIQIGEHEHRSLSCRTSAFLAGPQLPSCDREIGRSYVCEEDLPVEGQSGLQDRGDFAEVTVPPGNYLMIGDNRDNSEDGRYWGFVPAENLVGSARRIWFNADLQRAKVFNWSRIGTRIE